ncbi:helix-loop-helix DNA-binding domain-containing protein [Sporodiniella umbellata]|nr:helix-loop-helix DNA-binding domain-containing protein [Sporodiniella umbellata]
MQQINYQEYYNGKIYPSPIETSSPKSTHPKSSSLINKPYNNHRQSTTHTSQVTFNNTEQEVTQKKVAEILEKKQRRRESHNAVERRRRGNINDRIQELASLLPSSREAVKLNKGAILRRSVEHIRQLHEELRQNQYRIYDLENTLELYRDRLGNQIVTTHDPSTLDLSAMQPHNRHQ